MDADGKASILTDQLQEHTQRLETFIEAQLKLQTRILQDTLSVRLFKGNAEEVSSFTPKEHLPQLQEPEKEQQDEKDTVSIVAFDPDAIDDGDSNVVALSSEDVNEMQLRYWTPGRSSSRYSFVREVLNNRKEKASQYITKRESLQLPEGSIPPETQDGCSALNIVSSRFFVHGMMGIIVLNLILLGVEVDVASRLPQSEVPVWFSVANTIIVATYVLEVCLKLKAFGCGGFFLGPERLWNVFDFVIITLSVVETVFELLTFTSMRAFSDSSYLRSIRIIRVARALRGVRVIRLIHYIGALRTLVFSIASTSGSLVWTLVLLILVFYVFGVIIAQIVTDYCREYAQDTTGNLDALPFCEKHISQYWFGVSESMFTLFMAISGGISWEVSIKPLREISELAAACMVLYIVIAVFAILNVVTGVFCNTAIESAQADRDIAIMKYMAKHKAQVERLQTVFAEIDRDESDLVSIDELKAAMAEKKLASFMESLDISTQDVWSLFLIIDADESGTITLDEFVSGCMQLHGTAKSFQLAKMSYENKVTRQEIKHLSVQVSQLVRHFQLDLTQRSSLVRTRSSRSQN